MGKGLLNPLHMAKQSLVMPLKGEVPKIGGKDLSAQNVWDKMRGHTMAPPPPERVEMYNPNSPRTMQGIFIK